MWEHAWYLQYKNVKADYLKEIWKVVNWQEAERRYLKAANLGTPGVGTSIETKKERTGCECKIM